MAPRRQSGGSWSLVIGSDDLAAMTSWLREISEVTLRPTDSTLVLAGGGTEHRCAAINERVA
jgi:hypothetical protein